MENTGRYIIYKYRYYFFVVDILYFKRSKNDLFIIYRICFSHDDSGVTSLAAAVAVAAVVVLMQQHVTHISKHRFPLAQPYIYIYVYVCRELIELNLTLLEAITNTERIFYSSSSCSGVCIARDGIILVCGVV
jgi:hypothetical protein